MTVARARAAGRTDDGAWPLWLFGVAIGVQALLLAAWAWPAPLQDLPNHLARAVVIADLLFDGGVRFGSDYEFHWAFAPYVLADVLTAAGVQLLGVEATGRVLAGAAAVLPPIGVAWCARTLGASRAAAALAGLASMVLSLDYTLAAGYLAFKCSAALSFVAVGCLLRGLDASHRGWRWATVAAAVATYLTHLSGFVMLVAAVVALCACEALARRRLPAALVTAAAAVCTLGAIHIAWSAADAADAAYRFGTLAEKFHGALQSLATGDSGAERAIDLAVLALLPAAPLVALRGGAAARRVSWLCAAAVGAYLALPQSQPGVTYDTDLRALPQAFGFAAIAVALAIAPRARLAGAVAAACAVLAVAQVAITASPLRASAERVALLRDSLAGIPAGARVFPVITVDLDARLNPLLHAVAYATIDRGAFVPYLFVGVAGGHLGHFRARLPEAPPADHRWYADAAASPAPGAVADAYGYVTATLPWDERRLGLRLEALGATPVAATYRIAGGPIAGRRP